MFYAYFLTTAFIIGNPVHSRLNHISSLCPSQDRTIQGSTVGFELMIPLAPASAGIVCTLPHLVLVLLFS